MPLLFLITLSDCRHARQKLDSPRGRFYPVPKLAIVSDAKLHWTMSSDNAARYGSAGAIFGS